MVLKKLKSDTGIFDKICHAPLNSNSIDKDTIKESSQINPSKLGSDQVISNDSGQGEIGELKTLVVDLTKTMGSFFDMITTRMHGRL